MLDAEAPLQRAIEVNRSLIAGHAGVTRYRLRLMQNCLYLSGVLFIPRRLPGATSPGPRRLDELNEHLREVQDLLRGTDPSSPAEIVALSVIQKLLGDMLHATGRRVDGGGAYDRSIALLESLPEVPPDDPAYRHLLAALIGRMGQLSFCATVQPTKATDFYARALPEWERRASALSLKPTEQAARIRTHADLADRLERARRWSEAIDWRSRAVELTEGLFRQFPSVEEYRRMAAGQQGRLGRVLLATGRPREALPHVERSLALLPDELAFADQHVWSLVVYPNPFSNRAVELSEQLVAKEPANIVYQSRLAQARVRAGDWRRGQDVLERLVRQGVAGVDDRLFLAMACWHRGDAASARRWYDMAIATRDAPPHGYDAEIDALARETAALIGEGEDCSAVQPGHRR